MRILHYLRAMRVSDGGVVRAVLDMCAYQARAGHQVTLLTCDDTDVPAGWRGARAGVPRVVRAPAPRFGGLDPRFARHARSLVRDADVVHLHIIWDPALLAIARSARREGVPYIISGHGMLADWCLAQKRLKKQAYLAIGGRAALNNAAFIHLAGEGELEEAAKRHPRTPGRVIPLVFDVDPYSGDADPGPARAHYRLPAGDAPVVLFLSRLHYQKRPDLLVTAMRDLADRGKFFHLVIAGPSEPGYEARLREYARRLGVLDRCTFTGMVTSSHKASLYAACDLFALTSTEESFGLVYFESLACGTPVLTTRAAATWRELECSGGAGIIGKIASDVPYGEVGGGEVGELALVLGDLISDRRRLHEMGRTGRQWVLKHLDPGEVTGRYIEMYRDAVGGRSGARLPARAV